ncbi:hypothetical protein AMTR_s00080p00112800 [Amborella trichopoda]|uniref:Uncharacterized protein n=1 Tax=Amborella trichopoda TaxID=13333 RepID=W1PB52_AMBTC|nr:hypothetical protein AMTR_s00080p00112800 [Amborella trichopoda]
MGSETFLEVLLAILLPPVGVFLRYGCGVEFWIDLLLTILGYIPGDSNSRLEICFESNVFNNNVYLSWSFTFYGRLR